MEYVSVRCRTLLKMANAVSSISKTFMSTYPFILAYFKIVRLWLVWAAFSGLTSVEVVSHDLTWYLT